LYTGHVRCVGQQRLCDTSVRAKKGHSSVHTKHAFLGALAVLLGCILFAGSLPARAAALPSEIRQMVAAMKTVHSYKLTMDITSKVATQQTTSSVVLIAVRQGKTRALYEKMHLTLSGSTMNLEVVQQGTRTCIRGLMGPTWTCSTAKNSFMPGANLAGIANLNQLTAAVTQAFRITPIGRRTVQGQLCDGFWLAGKLSQVAMTGKVWISVASHLLVEEDATTSTPLSAGSKPTTLFTKVVASNYNDPHLSIPKV
jgi:hypothetical protein